MSGTMPVTNASDSDDSSSDNLSDSESSSDDDEGDLSSVIGAILGVETPSNRTASQPGPISCRLSL